MNDIIEQLISGALDSGDYTAKQSDSGSRPTLPIDGNLFATSEYLRTIHDTRGREWYRRYVKHIEYFTGLYKVTGSPEIDRLSPHILRQAIEFGKVAVWKHDGKLYASAVVNPTFNDAQELEKCTVTSLRTGIGYNANQKSFTLKGKYVAFLRSNYMALPFIYFWEDIIDTMIKLRKTATTASISSMKKFKRNLQNNDSEIARIETASMLDPNTPYINNIVSPATYKMEKDLAMRGSSPAAEKAQSLAPNAIEMTNVDSKAESLWENLKEYTNFEYYQMGRRINTNKKTERNVSGEIDVEVDNFMIMEREMEQYLENFIQEANEKLGISMKLQKVTAEIEQVKDEEGGDEPKQ